MRAQTQQLGDPAQLRAHHGLPVDDADDGAILVRRHGTAPLVGRIRRIGRDPGERDLITVEKAPQLRARRVPAMPDHDRAWRRLIGRDALQPADPLPRQLAELHPDLGRRGRDRVVVLGLDPHEARRLGGPKPEREPRPERDRHLPDELTDDAAADDALDPVDERDRLQATLEHGEQRPLVTRVDRVLARHDADVRRNPRKPLALDRAETGEDRDADDLLRRHHGRHALSPGMCSVRHPGAPQIVRFPDASDPASLSEADAEAMRRRSRAQLVAAGTAFCWATA